MIRHGRMILAAMVFSALAGACATPSASDDVDSSFGGSSVIVGGAWLESRLGSEGLVVVEVGADRADYDRGHLPGARFLDWHRIAVSRGGLSAELPDREESAAIVRGLGIEARDRVVLYDASDGTLAARAFLVFDLIGLGDDAALLDGQKAGWEREGRPLTAQVPVWSASEFRPGRGRAALVGLDEVRTLLASPTPPAFVDARPLAQFTGAEPGEGIARGGHLPGARHVDWRANQRGAEDARILPEADLERLYSAAGATPGRPVVVYCRTGNKSSWSYFALRRLGREVRMYDGSWQEWSAQPELPIATGSD